MQVFLCRDIISCIYSANKQQKIYYLYLDLVLPGMAYTVQDVHAYSYGKTHKFKNK